MQSVLHSAIPVEFVTPTRWDCLLSLVLPCPVPSLRASGVTHARPRCCCSLLNVVFPICGAGHPLAPLQVNDLTGVKESDTGLAPPSQWDLRADQQAMQEEQPLQVRALASAASKQCRRVVCHCPAVFNFLFP